MSSVPSFKAFDPTVAAVTATQDHGGGLIAGTGTFISKHTKIPVNSTITDVITIVNATGPITGTVTVEVSNSTDNMDALSAANWITYSNLPVSIPAVTTSAQFGIELINLGFSRMRTKFVVSAGTGTILDERAVKP